MTLLREINVWRIFGLIGFNQETKCALFAASFYNKFLYQLPLYNVLFSIPWKLLSDMNMESSNINEKYSICIFFS